MVLEFSHLQMYRTTQWRPTKIAARVHESKYQADHISQYPRNTKLTNLLASKQLQGETVHILCQLTSPLSPSWPLPANTSLDSTPSSSPANQKSSKLQKINLEQSSQLPIRSQKNTRSRTWEASDLLTWSWNRRMTHCGPSLVSIAKASRAVENATLALEQIGRMRAERGLAMDRAQT